MCPDEAYLFEKPYLIPLPPYTPPVYQSCYRVVDIQGYVHLDTNRYSVPHTLIGEKMEIQKHWLKVIIYRKDEKVAEHDRTIDNRNARSTLPGHHPPIRKKNLYQGPSKEELLLVGKDDLLDQYVADRSTAKLLNTLCRYDLLLLDELGYLTLNPEQMNAFFKLMKERYESGRSTIITTNLQPEKWYSLLQPKDMVDALLDRLNHRCITIHIDGLSLRTVASK